jgi:hypothetical protein
MGTVLAQAFVAAVVELTRVMGWIARRRWVLGALTLSTTALIATVVARHQATLAAKHLRAALIREAAGQPGERHRTYGVLLTQLSDYLYWFGLFFAVISMGCWFASYRRGEPRHRSLSIPLGGSLLGILLLVPNVAQRLRLALGFIYERTLGKWVQGLLAGEPRAWFGVAFGFAVTYWIMWRAPNPPRWR